MPILTTIKESFIDQRFGRRYDILVSKIADITDDLEHAPDGEEKSVYEQELAEAGLALERLRTFPGYAGWSLSNYRKLFTDRSFLQATFNTMAITLTGAVGTGGNGHVDRPVTDPSVSTAKASSAPSC